MNFNEDLFWTLLGLLEKEGFVMSTELANTIQFLFETEKIRTSADLKRSRHVLTAAIAKRSEEQLLLGRVFDNSAFTADADPTRPVRVHTAANLFWRSISRRIRISNLKLALIIAFFLAALGIAGFLLLRPEAAPPFFEAKILSDHPVENIPVDFELASGSRINFRYQCDFGDGRIVKELTKNVISHVYRRKGSYQVRFTVSASGKILTLVKTVLVSKAAAFSASTRSRGPKIERTNLRYISTVDFKDYPKLPLKEYPYLYQLKDKLITGNDFNLLRVILALAAAGVLLWFSYNRGLTSDIVSKYFDPKNKIRAPLKPVIPAAGLRHQKEFLQAFGNALQAAVAGGHSVFDIARSVTRTVSNLGFPTPFFSESPGAIRYLVLMEVRPANHHFTSVIENLLREMHGAPVQITLVYFTPGLKHFFGKSVQGEISRQQLVRGHAGSRLIVYSSGHSFLSDHHPTGFDQFSYEFLSGWDRRALVTDVPRNNWAEPEKRLLELMPLHAATLQDHLCMATVFQTGRYEFPKRTGDYINCPLSATIPAYQHFFETVQNQPALFVWALTLALPDECGWNLTLLTGNCVAMHYGLPEGQLVTHNNLLLLNYLPWLQRGNLDARHRAEMIGHLKADPAYAPLIRNIYTGLISQYEAFDYPEGSTAALLKNIKLVALNYQLNNTRALAERSVVQALYRNGQLDAYTTGLVKNDRRFYFSSKPVVYIVLFFITIAAWGFLNIAESYNPRLVLIAPLHRRTDSSAYFNNLAVSILKKDTTDRNLTLPVLYLHQAWGKNIYNDTAFYNSLVSKYRQGCLYYKRNAFGIAHDQFSSILDDVDFLKLQWDRDRLNHERAALRLPAISNNNLDTMIYDLRRHAYFNSVVCGSTDSMRNLSASKITLKLLKLAKDSTRIFADTKEYQK